MRLGTYCGVIFVTLGLAIVFVWIGFGPGERHFSGSGAFLGPLVGRAGIIDREPGEPLRGAGIDVVEQWPRAQRLDADDHA